MSIVKIESNIPFDSNIYLVKGRSAILIDTGTGLDSSNIISSIWNELGGIRLSAVLLTHCHADHTGGLYDIVLEFGCPAYVFDSDESFVTLSDKHTTFADALGLDPKPVPCKGLRETDTFDIGDHKLSIIHTPGHTVGSVCFFDEITKSLFSGDTVFARGYGRTDLPTGDSYQMHDSLLKLCNVNIGRLYPGHGPSADRGNESVREAINIMEGSY